MTLDPNTQSVVRPAHRIPVAMQDRVKAELVRMQSMGVITPATEPTDWVSSMVVAHKKNKHEIRLCINPKDLCINPKDLNTALKRAHHPMPFGINSASEVFQCMMGQLFTGYPCSVIIDDIIIGGRDMAEHGMNLR